MQVRGALRGLKPGGDLLIGTISRDSAREARYRLQAKRADSVFRRACFMTLDGLMELDGHNLEGSGECLFIPDSPPERINMEEEKRGARAGVRGGFLTALWKKPPAGLQAGVYL